ncbi:MAG: 16S rRNA (cytosine(967)-C(5))-methyltransferase RsmB [Clostridiales bacterium]|nr:16S rRNA (cytosine(967)-C(5))-methyltransferase RsmB [Clostridiales bacterium]
MKEKTDNGELQKTENENKERNHGDRAGKRSSEGKRDDTYKRKDFGKDRNNSFGERKPFKAEGRPFKAEGRPPYGKRQDGVNGERSYGRKSYSGDRNHGDRTGKGSFNREGNTAYKRDDFGKDRNNSFGERKPFKAEGRPPYEKRQDGVNGERSYGRKPYSRDRNHGDRTGKGSFNREENTAYKRDDFGKGRNNSFGERKPFKAEGRPFKAEGRPPYEKRQDGVNGERSYGRKPYSGDRNHATEYGKRRPEESRETSFTKNAFYGERKSFDAKDRFSENKRENRETNGFSYQEKRWVDHSQRTSSREVALLVINEVTEKQAYASIALDKKLKETNLSPVDKRLATQLVYGTIENFGKLDFVLDSLIHIRVDVHPTLWNILRLSTYQLLFLDKIPESAAVNEGVNLTKKLGLEHLTGFANGVLRNIIREKETIQWPDEQKEPVKYLTVMASVSSWLVEMLIEDYGYEQAKAFLLYQKPYQGIPLRPNKMKITTEELEKVLEEKEWEITKGKLPDVLWAKNTGDVEKDADFYQGKYSIQGEGSLVAAMATHVKPGMMVLDACAAPGGKTAYMAETMQGTGRVQAWDKHPHRVELLQAMKKRLQLENVRPMMKDAGEKREELYTSFDRVLVDAPCSGTGVIFEKPDIKARLTKEDIDALIKEQQRILDACAEYVKPGGMIIYSTCSVLKKENQAQIQWFTEKHPEYTVVPLPEAIPDTMREKYGEWGLQLLPQIDEVEGFFIACLKKKGSLW